MILFTLIFVLIIHDIQMEPATCIDDINCTVGFFCHPMTYQCRKCLGCDHFKRSPSTTASSCIKTGDQCGPCLQGFIKYETKWGALCLSPDSKNIRMLTSYIYVLVAAGVLLCLLIVHAIWNTNFVKVKLTIPLCNKKPLDKSKDNAMYVKQEPVTV